MATHAGAFACSPCVASWDRIALSSACAVSRRRCSLRGTCFRQSVLHSAERVVRRGLEFVAIGCLAVASHAGAFTFSDGTNATCVARGETVPEYAPPPGTEVMNFTGKTV